MSWKEFYERRKRAIALFAIALVTALMIAYYFNTQQQSISIVTHVTNVSDGPTFFYVTLPPAHFDTSDISEDEFADDEFGPSGFDINGSDVMVFLHMQKTGGTTFGKHLVNNLDLVKECINFANRKRRNCLRPNSDKETWLFSRVSTGWRCGLHSDWTELKECVDNKLNEIEKQVKTRRYFEVTVLRNPVDRYLSEYKHVRRGATWKNTRYACDHHDNSIPKCFEGKNWRGVALKDFMSCPNNMAANRQARMLADLRLVNCYERWLNKNLTHDEITSMDNAILESAKKNLKKMTFFGLTEEQVKMQTLFEYTFPFKFKKNFFQFNQTHISGYRVSQHELLAIKQMNSLDLDLYHYAVSLFHSRYKRFIKHHV